MDEEKNQSQLITAEFDKDAVVQHLKKLLQYLLESDTEAQSVLEEIQPMVNGTPMETSFTKIARHVSAYDFEEALDELENTSRQFDIKLEGSSDGSH